MNVFLNLKIRTKLIAGFMVVLALTTSWEFFRLSKLAGVRATTVDMGENWLPSIRALADMRIRIGKRTPVSIAIPACEKRRRQIRDKTDARHGRRIV